MTMQNNKLDALTMKWSRRANRSIPIAKASALKLVSNTEQDLRKQLYLPEHKSYYSNTKTSGVIKIDKDILEYR